MARRDRSFHKVAPLTGAQRQAEFKKRRNAKFVELTAMESEVKSLHQEWLLTMFGYELNNIPAKAPDAMQMLKAMRKALADAGKAVKARNKELKPRVRKQKPKAPDAAR